MDQRQAWSAAGGIVAVLAGTNAVAWAVGTSAPASPLPVWPAIAFAFMAVLGVYVLLSALVRWRPFNRLSLPPGEILDACIREGREAREEIVHNSMDTWKSARVAGEWTLRTSNALHEGFPAIVDRFLLASGNPDAFSGQALHIQTINAKIDVLTGTRLNLGS